MSSGNLRERDSNDVAGSLRATFDQRTGKASTALSEQHPSIAFTMLCYVLGGSTETVLAISLPNVIRNDGLQSY